VLGLVLLCIAGSLLNGEFATVDNAMNVLTRTAFIGIIAVGMCFVIISGGIDLSVGSMAALIAGCVILLMNTLATRGWSPVATVAAGMAFALVLGALFGLAHGLLITRGRIEPFIVTLGTLGIYRAYLTYFADGGAITLDNALSDRLQPGVLREPAGRAGAGSGCSRSSRWRRRHRSTARPTAATCRPSAPTSRWRAMPAVDVDRVKDPAPTVLLGVCVGAATLLYVPRLGSASPTTGLLWELEAIAA
jgi:ribose transport system permease protein